MTNIRHALNIYVYSYFRTILVKKSLFIGTFCFQNPAKPTNLNYILKTPQDLHNRPQQGSYVKTYKKSKAVSKLTDFTAFHPVTFKSKVLVFVVTTMVLGASAVAALVPKESSADMFSLLSSVFQSNSVGREPEITISDKNIQSMQLLAPTRVPVKTASSTEDLKLFMKESSRIVDGIALSNENTATVNGHTDLFDKDLQSDKISLYTVRNNDTIEQIARMFGVNVSTILWANDLKRGVALKPDQVLVIMPISSIQHIVSKGDTIQSVSKKYGADIEEVIQFNNIGDDQKLVLGTVIIIPDAEGSLTLAEQRKKDEEDKKSSKTQSKSKKGTLSTKITTTSSAGYFSRPVAGGVRTQGIHGHNGIDIAAPLNTPILAAASGRVVVAKDGGWNGGYGSYVVIQHDNGMQTLYAHLNRVDVNVGSTISKGQTIGAMGTTGRSTGIHLHFEVRGGRNPF